MRLIRSRYDGRCAGCGKWFPAGTQVAYDPETKLSYHSECQAAAEIPAPFRVTKEGGGEGGYTFWGFVPGEVIKPRAYLREKGYPEYVTAVRVGRRNSPDGRMDSYIYWADCRPATDEEIAAKLQKEEESRRASVLRRIREIKEQMMRVGEMPAQVGAVDGEIILDARDSSGVGDWFVVQRPDWLWYMDKLVPGDAEPLSWRRPLDGSWRLVVELKSLQRLLGGSVDTEEKEGSA